MDDPTTHVIVIPVDQAEPPRVVQLDQAGYQHVKQLVGGAVADPGRYDRDAIIWVDGDGANRGLPPNVRVTRYVFGHSQAAAQNRTDPDAPPYWLHGPAVITGGDYDTPPARFFTLFGIEAPAT